MIPPVTLIWYVILALWLSYLPYGTDFALNYLRHRKQFVYRVAGDEAKVNSRLLVQVTTRSATAVLGNVSRAVQAAHAAFAEAGHLFSECSVVVLSEDPRDLEHFPDAVIVPASYTCNAVRKARALDYATQFWKARPRAELKDTWVLHLDEESVILPQTLYAISSFIAHNPKKVLAEGPIFFPPELSTNAATNVADSVRASTCYFCVGTMTNGRAPNHLHGSNLLVRMDVECDVGWAHGASIAEDQLFGLEVFRKYPGRFGWHGGQVLESSPATVAGLVAQRKRWVAGTLQNWRKMQASVKRNVAYRFSVWGIGFFAALTAIPLWIITFAYLPLKALGSSLTASFAYAPFLTGGQIFYDLFDGRLFNYYLPFKPLPTLLGISALVSLSLWIFQYLIGFYHNQSLSPDTIESNRRTLRDFGILLGSVWFVGLLENYPFILGIVAKMRGRFDWVVTPKSLARHATAPWIFIAAGVLFLLLEVAVLAGVLT